MEGQDPDLDLQIASPMSVIARVAVNRGVPAKPE
jgi:hypothetical protein